MQSPIKLSLNALSHSYIWRIQVRIPPPDSELGYNQEQILYLHYIHAQES